jgi:hypothetical protein
MLSEELKEEISAPEFSIPFDEFVDSLTGRRILERLLDITKKQEKEISAALEGLIDLDAHVKIGRVKHVYRDLVTIWCYLIRIAVASRIWGELIHSATDEYPKSTMTLKRLRETFVGLRELSDAAIDKGIHHFSSSMDQKHTVDLFYQPLLRMTEEEVPSSEEIRRLISSLSLPRACPPKGTSERRIELGGWTLIMDAKGLI